VVDNGGNWQILFKVIVMKESILELSPNCEASHFERELCLIEGEARVS